MTQASTTKFCTEKLVGNDGRYLIVDGNQKIADDFHDPKPNAFSLLPVTDCPYRTPTCETSCYVHNLAKFAPDVYDAYAHNSATIREILENDAAYWQHHLADWIETHCYTGFRWHVSGDIFSFEYAGFIAGVVAMTTVQHWIYTRSLPYLEPIVGLPNLAVNISADKDNFNVARVAAKDYNVQLCFLTTNGYIPANMPLDGIIFPDYALREGDWFSNLPRARARQVCPVDMFGKTSSRRCMTCRKCF